MGFNKRGEKIKKPPIRKLTNYEEAYLEELKKYNSVLSTTLLISRNQHGIDTTGRGIRGTRIFTRQTLLGMSLKTILPYPTIHKHYEEDLWDICSISSLARNILEGYLSLNYFGTEKISDEEAELRFFLLQFHRNREWYQLRVKFRKPDDELNTVANELEEQRNNIKNHSYISNLTKEQRNKVLQGNEMYRTKADFEVENEICEGLRFEYQLLSNLVHPLPLSFERINNERGRGIGSDSDINYCILALIIARKYLAASTIEISDFFYEQLGEKFKKQLDKIRPYQSKGS